MVLANYNNRGVYLLTVAGAVSWLQRFFQEVQTQLVDGWLEEVILHQTNTNSMERMRKNGNETLNYKTTIQTNLLSLTCLPLSLPQSVRHFSLESFWSVEGGSLSGPCCRLLLRSDFLPSSCPSPGVCHTETTGWLQPAPRTEDSTARSGF